MMQTSSLLTLLGGLGLFLLGMSLMTNGLKTAAGSALERILHVWTYSNPRALFTGIGLTGLIQSSSGVTVATIGFVNAGLLTLEQALWVIFGSNIGTTLTAWLVALLGFNFKIDAFALPLIGLGAMMHVFGRGKRWPALGLGIAGFGMLFMGIDVLKSLFGDVGAELNLAEWVSPGIAGMLVMLAIGTVMTVLMQSSSAAIAIIVTAVGSGVLPLEQAAAAVIGANIGTTSTALLAVLNGTSNARRVALGHVVFNLMTGVFAILALPWVAEASLWMGERLRDVTMTPALMLALFHTIFNIVGVMLMIPVSAALVRFLKQRFRSMEENLSHPVHLDTTLLGTPSLGIRAVLLEIRRVAQFSLQSMLGAISHEARDHRVSEVTNSRIAVNLGRSIADYLPRLSTAELTENESNSITQCINATEYYREIALASHAIAELQSSILESGDPKIDDELNVWLSRAVGCLNACDPNADSFGAESLEAAYREMDEAYDHLKMHLFQASARRQLPLGKMEHRLELIRIIKFYVQKARKAARILLRQWEAFPVEIALQKSAEASADAGTAPPE